MSATAERDHLRAAMLFDSILRADRRLQLGPVVVAAVAPPTVQAGAVDRPVKVEVRPEAWRIAAPGAGELAAKVLKSAYLGSTREYTFETALGEVFVVAADTSRTLAAGEPASLSLVANGVAIVPTDNTPGSA